MTWVMCYVSSQRRMKLCLTPPPKGHGVFPASPIHWWLCWRLKSFHGMVANWHCMKMSIFAPKQASVDTTIEKFSDLLLTAHCVVRWAQQRWWSSCMSSFVWVCVTIFSLQCSGAVFGVGRAPRPIVPCPRPPPSHIPTSEVTFYWLVI